MSKGLKEMSESSQDSNDRHSFPYSSLYPSSMSDNGQLYGQNNGPYCDYSQPPPVHPGASGGHPKMSLPHSGFPGQMTYNPSYLPPPLVFGHNTLSSHNFPSNGQCYQGAINQYAQLPANQEQNTSYDLGHFNHTEASASKASKTEDLYGWFGFNTEGKVRAEEHFSGKSHSKDISSEDLRLSRSSGLRKQSYGKDRSLKVENFKIETSHEKDNSPGVKSESGRKVGLASSGDNYSSKHSWNSRTSFASGHSSTSSRTNPRLSSHNSRKDKTSQNEQKMERPKLDKLVEKDDYGSSDNENEDKTLWVRSSPAELFYSRDAGNPSLVRATKKLMALCEEFQDVLITKPRLIKSDKLKEVEEKLKADIGQGFCSVHGVSERLDDGNKSDIMDTVSKSCEENPSKVDTENVTDTEASCTCPPHDQYRDYKGRKSYHACSSSNEDSGSSSSDESDEDEDQATKELERKKRHPLRLHTELWFNDPGEMNDGPLCRCSLRARRSGIRHGFYEGEEINASCCAFSNNADKLYHYFITVSPPTNFLVKTPTAIMFDNHEFVFEGFSLFSHYPLGDIPTCNVVRFNIQYTIHYVSEKMPENFCTKELDLFCNYFFFEILELIDWDLHSSTGNDSCPCFHFMPRFVRMLPENGKEVLSMNEVLNFLLNSYKPLINTEDLAQILQMSQHEWQNFADNTKGMIVTCPGVKPCSIRVDQLDRDQLSNETINYPVIVHFGIRPPQLSYAGNPNYQKAWREYVKFRHLLANMPKPSMEDKRQLCAKECQLQSMRMSSKMKRDVTVAVSAQHFYYTGLMSDIVQHAMLLPVLVSHLRFHGSLHVLEKQMNYQFKNKYLLQLALTHPSYRENFGTNPDHARNTLTNCGIRQPEYGDRRIHYKNTRKRGINTLINIMSRFGKKSETDSKINHNERLEFLGDAVVEFLASIHLFHMFPVLEEGGLATYRAAIVQNQHLAVLAEKLHLDHFMLYAHGSDLCHDYELRHAMANCFEALMGAIFIDSDIEAADTVFSSTLFKDEKILQDVWVNYPLHPLQEQEPLGDRKWVDSFPILEKLVAFEESIGVQFKHIRLLARAFTDRSIGFNNLTLGSNQRLEFLGDTVLQLIASEYLYRHYPEHHEGHLSLLRSSLVNNRTQAVVCDDLDMVTYAFYSHLKTELKTKDRADLLEAFLGALYIDRGLEYCQVFCAVCFFPRLHQFIMNQDWNDPKSKLQQCCLTLRTMEGGEPDIPIYKVIECKGPTNTRVYTVAVYFRDQRLAKASGHSIQQAEMNAAKEALNNSKDFFPQLDHQKRVIEKSMKIQAENIISSKHEAERKREDRCERRDRHQGRKGENPKRRRSPSSMSLESGSAKRPYDRNAYRKDSSRRSHEKDRKL